MGYYTTYKLEVVENNDEIDLDQLIENINKLGGYEMFQDSDMSCHCKWYDYTDHMKEISKQYPKSIFLLSGSGGESGDLWKEYYQNGVAKYYGGEIVYHDDNFKNDLKEAEK